jgi:integrase
MVPKEPEKEMQILTESQVSQLLVTVMEHRWKALYFLAVTSGMRQMEMLGLKWSDLDWVKKSIYVERQLSRKQDGDGIMFAPLKTDKSRRSIDLGNRSIQILRKHDQRQQETRKKAGDSWIENGLIFTNSKGGPIHYRNLLRSFKIILKHAGLPEIRFHDLRHTAASLMLNHGVAPLVVSQRLGHARPSITLDTYGHLLPSIQSEAAKLLDELVTPVELPKNLTALHTVAHELRFS